MARRLAMLAYWLTSGTVATACGAASASASGASGWLRIAVWAAMTGVVTVLAIFAADPLVDAAMRRW